VGAAPEGSSGEPTASEARAGTADLSGHAGVVDRPAPSSIPDAPGSYQFLDAEGRVLYVGKAKSLRQRVASYFQSPAGLAPRVAQMVAAAERVEWIQVGSDVEAFMLEYSLIKEHRPRFNIRLRDDKSYPWLALTVADTWPRPLVVRGRRRKGVRYFGPYPHAYAIRDTLDLLLRSFPVRSCSDAKLDRHTRAGRPCLLFHIERCCGPCTGEVAPERYAELVEGLTEVLNGRTDAVEARLETEMHEAADRLEFERAARLRDRLGALRTAAARQEMVTTRGDDLDVVAVADDELEAAVQVLHVRHGRVVGRRGSVVDKVEEVTAAGLVGRILAELYGDGTASVPREVLVPELPEDPEVLGAWLRLQRGGPVRVSVPQRGRRRALQATAAANAAEELRRHRLRRAVDHNARAEALTALAGALGLPLAPLRIECFDMSHLQGSDYVGSMVVMEDGLATPREYRKFRIRDVAGNNDVGAMEEVLRRRFSRLLADEAAGPAKGKRFSYPPQLLLLDGGLPQLGVGVRVLAELGLTERVPVAALAKQFEEVYLPSREAPVRIPRDSPALYLLQQVRDEAHRFAITYHRQLRARRSKASVLDGIPGLGPARRARLLRELGGLAGLRRASHDQLAECSWLPAPVAAAVWASLHPEGAGGSGAPETRRERGGAGEHDEPGEARRSGGDGETGEHAESGERAGSPPRLLAGARSAG
jgi:excinuclease ABC subunit C